MKKHVLVDTSALVGSPEPSGRFVEAIAFGVNSVGQVYVFPNVSGSGLWVDASLVKPGKIKTIHDMLDALRLTFADDPKYALTLCGPRRRGSTTERGIFRREQDGAIVSDYSHDVRDATNRVVDGVRVPGATYYVADLPEVGGKLGAVPWGSLAPAEQREVIMVHGEHGPELRLNREHFEEPLPPADDIWFIVGPKGDLWTWHPGPPLAPYDPSASEPSPMTAVKIVEGAR